MKKRVIFGVLAAASLAAAAYAAPVVKTGAGFTKMDADGDGNVTKTEALAHADTRFAVMDADGNGQIDTRDRVARAKLRFAEMDADRSGTVDEAEFVTASNAKAAARNSRRAAKAESESGRKGGFGRGDDANGVARGGGRDRDQYRNDNANNAGSWGKGDTNNDQAISRAEYNAATGSRFAARDKDGNGALSADEMKFARKGMRMRTRTP